MMRNFSVLACVPLLLVGCDQSTESSSSSAARDSAPLLLTQPVVAPDPLFIGSIPPELVDEFLNFREDPWRGLPWLDIPGPNYDRWDRHQEFRSMRFATPVHDPIHY